MRNNKMTNATKLHHSIYISTLLGLPLNAMAGGLGITVQSSSVGGNAATGHALAEDASAMWYNPALLSSMNGIQINGGIAIVNTELNLTDTGSTTPAAFGNGQVDGGANGMVDPGGTSVTPSLFYKRDLSARNMAFGLGINVPFGVATEYDDDSFTRYEAVESHLQTVNINPALSWRVNDKFDVGAGVSIQVGKATLTKAVDSAAACLTLQARVNPAIDCTGNGLGVANLSDQSLDSSVSIEADGVGYGANIGGVYHPNNSTTLSLGLRSAVNYDLEGEADFDLNSTLVSTAGAAVGLAGLTDQDAESALKLPASASLAFAKNVSEKLAVHGDMTWTQWSSVPEIRIKFPDTARTDSVTNVQWNDTTRVGLGMTYKMNPKTTLRTGVAFDPTPTPDAEHRTPRAPSSDNLWLSGGISHQMNKQVGVDVSLSVVRPEDATVNYTGDTGYTTRGEMDSAVYVGAVSLNYHF
ncbi:MAG: Unknown protein [uncultured Thiotrichaceae bacterium]|uniref:Long-chain fatty acid transport protein n=1 Tax=uncultured Thiotrichaceae bacterium TaxID=298394 RepID=A0A6S6TI80_9GAMM|nr:MAG: Unknown protein [uncultured Thiotrichaceae bacterium]